MEVNLPDHDTRGNGELNNRKGVMKRSHGESPPRIPTPPSKDVHELPHHHQPRRHTQRTHRSGHPEPHHAHQNPRERHVECQLRRGEPGDHDVPLLGLQVHLDGEGEDDAVEEWDEPERDVTRGSCYGFVLAEEREYEPREDEDGKE